VAYFKALSPHLFLKIEKIPPVIRPRYELDVYSASVPTELYCA